MIDLETLVLLIFVAVLTLVITTYMELKKKLKKPEYVTRELLECTSCGYKLEHDHEPGDFISMFKGECPRCGSLMRIKAIYSVEKKTLIPPQ